VVRHGDNQFADIVRWTQFAMIEAEEYGITSKNVDEMMKSDNPTIKRILGVTPGMGKALGVDEKWVYNIIKQVGNYGESFERNVGMGSPLKIARGQNELWTKGGLQYAIPFQDCWGRAPALPLRSNRIFLMRLVETSRAAILPELSRTRWASWATVIQLPGVSSSTVSALTLRIGQAGPLAINGPLTWASQVSPLRLTAQAAPESAET
jgi:hypothetical protein